MACFGALKNMRVSIIYICDPVLVVQFNFYLTVGCLHPVYVFL